jgi:hypothetical protein
MKRHLRHALVLGATALLVLGCNSILQNEPGILATDQDETLPANDGGGSTPPPAQTEPPGGNGEPPPDGGQPPAADCSDGERLCDGECVSNDDPDYGCGDAACRPCSSRNGTAACAGGACTMSACDPGFDDCNNDPLDGCEADLSRAGSCGACTVACTPLAPLCAPAGAGFACTTACAPPATLCVDECVDTLTSRNHCGACGAACPEVENGTVACQAGACTFTCRPNYRACPDRCVTRTDPTACGPECLPCPVPPNARATCQANACAFQCDPGFADCDLDPATGCEVELATNPAHCGACGKACDADEVCIAGECEDAP